MAEKIKPIGFIYCIPKGNLKEDKRSRAEKRLFEASYLVIIQIENAGNKTIRKQTIKNPKIEKDLGETNFFTKEKASKRSKPTVAPRELATKCEIKKQQIGNK